MMYAMELTAQEVSQSLFRLCIDLGMEHFKELLDVDVLERSCNINKLRFLHLKVEKVDFSFGDF